MGDLFYVTLSGHLGVCVSLMFEIESGCGVTVFEMEERLTAWPHFELAFMAYIVYKFKTSWPSLKFICTHSVHLVCKCIHCHIYQIKRLIFCSCWKPILPYLILVRGSISLCSESAPWFFVLLFFPRWYISVWIISLLHDPAALTLLICVCTRHTRTTACMYTDTNAQTSRHTSSTLSIFLLPAWCQRGCFKARTVIRGTRRRGVTEGTAYENGVCMDVQEMCGMHC